MRFFAATFAVRACLLLLAIPSVVEGAFTSQVVGTVATMTGDASGDVLNITHSTTGAATFASYTLGQAGDTPVAGDYDGDGRSDLAVFRPSNGLWSILTSSSGFTTTSTFTWGASGDIPILRRP